MQRILRGRLTFTPRTSVITGEVDGYDFGCATRFDKLFTGVAVERPAGIDEGYLGSEGIGREDTHDGDYGRLLESVFWKRVGVPEAKFRPGPLSAGSVIGVLLPEGIGALSRERDRAPPSSYPPESAFAPHLSSVPRRAQTVTAWSHSPPH